MCKSACGKLVIGYIEDRYRNGVQQRRHIAVKTGNRNLTAEKTGV